MIISSATDYREAARRKLPPFLFHYLDGGAGTETTLRANVDDLQQVALRQRVLKGSAQLDLSTEWFGTSHRLPVALAPIGLAGMYARRGEVQAARVAAERGIPFIQSTVSVCALKEVAGRCDQPLWCQLYVLKDRGFMRDYLRRARELGIETLVFTVDMPVPGARYRDAHSGMSGRNGPLRRVVQAMLHPRWALDVGLLGRPHDLGNISTYRGNPTGLADYIGWLAANFDPGIDWADLQWIRDEWDGPMVIKGILDADDARVLRRGRHRRLEPRRAPAGRRAVDGQGLAGDRRRSQGRHDDPRRRRRAHGPGRRAHAGAGRGRRAAGPRLHLRAGRRRRGGRAQAAGHLREGYPDQHGADGREVRARDRAGDSRLGSTRPVFR